MEIIYDGVTIIKEDQDSGSFSSSGLIIKTGIGNQQIVIGYDQVDGHGFISASDGSGKPLILNPLGGDVEAKGNIKAKGYIVESSQAEKSTENTLFDLLKNIVVNDGNMYEVNGPVYKHEGPLDSVSEGSNITHAKRINATKIRLYGMNNASIKNMDLIDGSSVMTTWSISY